MEKAALRRLLSEKANAIPLADRRTYSAAIAREVLRSSVWQKAGSVVLYLSMPTEPDTSALIAAAFAAGKRVCLPKCVDRHTMIAVPVADLNGLVPGGFGIPEPAFLPEDTAPPQIDLTVAPCVGASENGGRIGHGAGYYDRFLAERHTFKLCLCFSELLTAGIPLGEHDIRMDAVVTETGVYPPWNAIDAYRF